MDRVPGLDKSQIEDVIMGCAFPEAEQGMNVARTSTTKNGIDLAAAASYRQAADKILYDAKTPKGALPVKWRFRPNRRWAFTRWWCRR